MRGNHRRSADNRAVKKGLLVFGAVAGGCDDDTVTNNELLQFEHRILHKIICTQNFKYQENYLNIHIQIMDKHTNALNILTTS